MELANGGSLDEYIQIQPPPDLPDLSAMSGAERIRALKALRERHQEERHWRGITSRGGGGSIGGSGYTSGVVDSATMKSRLLGGIGRSLMGSKVRYLTDRQIWSFFLDICEGLGHLHAHGIIHRDLKPPNLLLIFDDPNDPDEIPRVLISDFGECEVIGDSVERNTQRSGGTGTLEFLSPELLETDELGNYTHEHSLGGDMFSLGVVLFFLCYSRVPYSQVDDVDLLKEEILHFSRVEFPKEDDERVPDELKTLIVRLLARKPQDRPSIEEVLQAYRDRRLEIDRKIWTS